MGTRERRATLETSCTKPKSLEKVFWNALRNFQTPFQIHGEARPFYYSISKSYATKKLSKTLGGCQQQDSFPFFKLPAELRAEILRLVLSYPKSGMEWSPDLEFEQPTRFRLLTRDFGQPFSFANWDQTRPASLEARIDRDAVLSQPVSGLLAPLSVSRQFYKEAMPLFYSTNVFYFRCLHVLEAFLVTLPPLRRQHIAHVAFTYRSENMARAPPTFAELVKIKHLQRLDIRIDEAQWLSDGDGENLEMYGSVTNMPGLKDLKAKRGLHEVTFHGECPTIEAMLRADMLTPKPSKRIKNGRGGNGKCKAASEGDKGGVTQSSTIKKSKTN